MIPFGFLSFGNNFKEFFFLRIPTFTTCFCVNLLTCFQTIVITHLPLFYTFLLIKIHSFQQEQTRSQILHEGEMFPHADFVTGKILWIRYIVQQKTSSSSQISFNCPIAEHYSSIIKQGSTGYLKIHYFSPYWSSFYMPV